MQTFVAAVSQEARESMRAAYEQSLANGVPATAQPTSNKSLDTTKNDRIRILHLRVFADAIMTWNRALGGSYERPLLDAINSHESDARDTDLDPWENLVEMFNNYSGRELNEFQPENLAVKYAEGRKAIPLVPRNETISNEVFEKLKSLDPNEKQRPLRTGKWLKEQWAKLRTAISAVLEKFRRSGQQRGPLGSVLGNDDWVLNFSNGDQVVMYAGLVLDQGVLDHLGTVLPEGTGRDTGIVGTDNLELSSFTSPNIDSEQRSQKTKRKSEMRAIQRQKKRSVDTSNDSDEEMSDINSVIQSSLSYGHRLKAKSDENDSRLKSLMYLHQNASNQQYRLLAEQEILKAAGLGHLIPVESVPSSSSSSSSSMFSPST